MPAASHCGQATGAVCATTPTGVTTTGSATGVRAAATPSIRQIGRKMRPVYF